MMERTKDQIAWAAGFTWILVASAFLIWIFLICVITPSHTFTVTINGFNEMYPESIGLTALFFGFLYWAKRGGMRLPP